MKARPYQQEAVRKVLNEWKEKQSTLVVMPTGTGKTVVFSHIIRACFPKKALVLAHRRELIQQAADKIHRVTGYRCDIEMGELRAAMDGDMWHRPQVVVSSIQTQAAGGDGGGRMGRFNPMDFGLLIIDEGHRSVGDSYKRTLDYYKANPNIKILGVTATPDRADEEALGQIFETVAFDYEILDAIHDGWLVPVEQQMIHVAGLDYSNVGTTAGDLNQGDLADVVEQEKNLHGIAHPTIDLAGDRRAIVFCATVKQAERMAEIFNRHKADSAAFVCGKTDKEVRNKINRDFGAGKIQFLCNVGTHTEGFDDPGVSIVVMARATKSRSLYAQMCLDYQTEILCKRGWVGPQDIRDDDMVAAFNRSNEVIEWCDILERIDRPMASGESMYGISSPIIDIRVTNKHSMIYRARKFSGDHSAWKESCADEMLQSFQIPCAGRSGLPDMPLSDDELRFIAWVMTDGSINKRNGQIQITQAEHQPWLHEIEDCIVKCGLKYNKTVSWRKSTKFNQTSRRVLFTISKGAPRGTGKHLRGWGHLEKYIDKNLSPKLLEMSDRQFGVFIHSLHLGDGSKQVNDQYTRRSYHIAARRDEFANNLQAMCATRGFSCNIAKHHYNKNPLNIIHAKPSMIRNIVRAASDGRPTWGTLPHSHGERVWCVKNRLGTIVTRRSGKVAIVGNCGRAMRPSEDIAVELGMIESADERRELILNSKKATCLVVDFVGNSGRHKLVTTADILGGNVSDDAMVRAAQAAKQSGKPVRMDQLLDEKQEEIQREVEEQKKRAIANRLRMVARAKYTTQTVSPFDVLDIHPVRDRGWDTGRQLTDKQRDLLLKQGINPDGMNYAAQKQLLNEIFRRFSNNLCSYKQATMLKKRGLPCDVSREQASKMIDEIAKKEGWGKR